MGQAKTKVECPLCGSHSDTDDGCDTASVNGAGSPEKETAQCNAAKTPLLALEEDAIAGRGHPSTISLPAYVGTGPLTSVAEEPGVTGDVCEDGTLAENHTTSLRHQLVVLRGNRHHPQGHHVRFDTENGPAHGTGRSLSVTQGTGYSFPQRRESFLYRSDSDFELSPRSAGSRHSSLTSEQHSVVPEQQEQIVTPFAQILHTLHNVHKNYMLLTNVNSNRSMRRRSASVEKPDVAGTASARDSIVEATPPSGDQITPPIFELSGSTTSSTLSPAIAGPDEEHASKMMMETLEELEWCLEQLETIQTHKSVSDMATSKFKRMLNKELSQFAESSKAGNQISEYISCTFLDKQQDVDLSSTAAAVAKESRGSSAVSSCTGSSASSTNLQRRASAGSFHQSLSKKKAGKKAAPMSHIPGIRPSKHHAKRFNGVLSKYGVHPANAEQLAESMGLVNCWGMPIFSVTSASNNRPLTAVFYTILTERGLTKSFSMSPGTLVGYLTRVEDHYRQDVPYHNSTHAADVTQSSHVLLAMPALHKIFTELEVLATLFASAIHDVDHPGVTNQYLVNTGSELALMYNDESVLESHHLAVAFKLLQEDELDIFHTLPAKSRQTLRRMVIEIVLATDMNKHMDHIANLKTMVETRKLSGSDVLSLESYSERVQVLKSLVHCSDLSNPTKPLDLYRRWTDRIMQEFFRQGDLEREQDLDVSPMCDRRTATIEKSQVGFIDYIVQPLWETWADLVQPDCQEILELLEDNREWYRSRIVMSPSDINVRDTGTTSKTDADRETSAASPGPEESLASNLDVPGDGTGQCESVEETVQHPDIQSTSRNISVNVTLTVAMRTLTTTTQSTAAAGDELRNRQNGGPTPSSVPSPVVSSQPTSPSLHISPSPAADDGGAMKITDV